MKHVLMLLLLAPAIQQVSAQTKLRDSLPAVKVTAEKKQAIATNAQSELKTTQLFQAAGQTLGETLKSLPGLNSIQTGPSISKPVIHGLHSN
ncbi:MAG: hypothetical protein JST68_08520, partial [Bacteroidetes bacterium]|nr:hypothetical protein [Bacteroidota bacterium]